jgi:hypothetical protein
MKSSIKISLQIAAILSLGILPARAQMEPGQRAVPLGYCQIAAATLASVTGLASCSGGIPAGANMILMQAEAQNIRWRDDGTNPTTAVGMLLLSAQAPVPYTGTISALKFIDATAGGLLDVSFYKTP